jgi:acyl-CoA synthetase (AMP-forming)/AMP-acid ligase II
LFFHSSQEREAVALRDAVEELEILVCIDRESEAGPSLLAWADSFTDDFKLPHRDADAVAVYMGTGGTTGHPKAVVLTDRVFETMVANFVAAMGLDDDAPPVHLLATPMSHASGFCALPLMAAGARQLFMPGVDIGELLETISRERVTHIFLPPTVIYLMLAHPRARDFDYSALRHLIYAAAPMSVEKLREAIEIFGPVMSQLYGQAEAPLTCTYLSPSDHDIDGDPQHTRRLWSCGRRTLFTPVAIMDDEGTLLPAGERGEIVVRGPLVMRGYLDDTVATASVTTGEWRRTGDIGELDEAGSLVAPRDT